MSSTIPVIRVTEIGEYIRHHSCARRLKLDHNDREEARKLPQITRLFTPLDPVLQAEGRRREDEWEAYLVEQGMTCLNLPDDGDTLPWASFADRVRQLAPGEHAFAREVRVEVNLGAFHLVGQIDFALILGQEDQPVLRLVEGKASRKDRTYHRAQVATYRLMVQKLLDASPLSIAGVLVDSDQVEAVVARIDEATNHSQAILELNPLDLTNYEADVQRLLAPDGPFERILATNVDGLPYTLEPKCDSCVFNVHCFPESARQRRLELLGLEPSTVRALQAVGIHTLDDLANLDATGPTAAQIRSQAGFAENLQHLQIRARVRCRTLPGGDALDGTYEVEQVPRTGLGQLPEHEVNGQRLVRVYLNVDYDYVENRVVGLAAHVTTSDGELATRFIQEDGRWRPDPVVHESHDNRVRPLRGTDIVIMQRTPWTGDYETDTEAERGLIESFLRELVAAMHGEAGADTAPIHFYVWSRSDLTQLIEACTRADSRLLAHLTELLGCREELEQLIFSSLSDEVRQRFATGWTGTGLTVAASLRWFGKSYHWHRLVDSTPVNLDRHFNRDVFDFLTVLHQHADGTWAYPDEGAPNQHRFEIRSRHFDTLSAPYWRAMWGTLPDPNTVDKAETARAIRIYQDAATPQTLRALLVARVHAMRWIEERIRLKNRDIEKPVLKLAALSHFTLGVNDVARAALDVIRLDQRVKRNDWVTGLLRPPASRVPQGLSIPLRNVRAVDDRSLIAEIDLAGYDVSQEELQRRAKFDTGDFVRLTPGPADPHEGQHIGQILYGGRTCVIDLIDWARGDVRLSIIPAYHADLYTAVSYTAGYPSSNAEYNFPFAHATLDESITDYTASKVDRRLESRLGSHMFDWFDPTHPQVPAQPQIDPDLMKAYRSLIQKLVLPNGHPLARSQENACLEGLQARIQLLLGPPGTGKTTTAGAAVLLRTLAHHEPGHLVLVAANTHTALDNLLRAIDETQVGFEQAAREEGFAIPEVRVTKVHSSRIDQSLGNIDDVTARKAPAYIRNYLNPRGEAPKGVLILGGTTGSLLKMAREYGNNFQADELIVDEASMLLFPHFLALATLVKPDGTLMLAGDHRQLAPIVAHDWEREDRPPTVRYQPYVSAYKAVLRLKEDPESGREIPDMEDSKVLRSALTYTFRLPASVRELIAPVYRQDRVELEGRPPVIITDDIGVDGDPLRAVMQHGSGLFLILHNERGSKQHNPFEATVIERLLAAANGLPDNAVALITPHRAQRSHLQAQFGERPEVDLIDTVNRLQGGERPIIIVSATVSDPAAINARAEFVLGLERSNVAFSRPQQRLIVIASDALTDHIPSEIEHYEAAMLWKHLRASCSYLLGTSYIEQHQVQVFTVHSNLPPR